MNDAATALVSHFRHLYGEKEFDDACKQEWITCENCGREVLDFLHVPVFDYIGCVDCYSEAMKELQRREAESLKRKPLVMADDSVREEVRMFFEAGASIEEYRQYKIHFDKEVA